MKYFSISEFDCQETGENKMDSEFLQKLDLLREACGFPFVINSGYRSPNHSIEKAKSKPGTHAQGIAAYIRVSNGIQRAQIVESAIALGFNGIGVHDQFVHVDTRKSKRVLWCY
jgi:uncharacterized protein YcbK (DUF882 family)